MSEAFKDFLDYFGSDQERYVWELPDGAIASELEMNLPPLSGLDKADLQCRSQRFFDSLDGLCVGQSEIINAGLLARIAGLLPRQQCLDILKICQEKRNLVMDYREQLRLAIAELLPQWHDEDRTILMRSYAGAFRSGTTTNDPLQDVEKDWEAMSSVEQAQHVVAIADLVLTELNAAETEGNE